MAFRRQVKEPILKQMAIVRKEAARTSCMWCVLVLMASVGILCQGCTTLRPTDPYEQTRSVRSERTLGDPAEPELLLDEATFIEERIPERPMELDDCIAYALRNNPEIAAKSWDAEAAREEENIQGGKRWPQLRLSGSYFHHQDAQRIVPPSQPGGTSYFAKELAAADLWLRLPLYTGGRIINEVRAAELLARSAEHTLARTREELVFNVTSIYFAILTQRHVIESLEFSRETLEEHVARVQDLIDAQKAAQVDRLRTEVRLADLNQRLIHEKNVMAVQFRLLSNLMGRSEGDASQLEVAGTLTMPEIPDADRSTAQAFDRRADYAAAAAALEAQARLVDAARGIREPQVDLQASYGGRWGFGGSGAPGTSLSRTFAVDAQGNPTYSFSSPLSGGASVSPTFGANGLNSLRYSRNTADTADSFEDVGRIGVNVDIPLFEGGGLRAQVARERAKLHAAQQRLRKLELQIRLEVETALLNLESARERVGVTQKSIAEAEESLRIEREKYDFGKGAIVDVLDAQAALLNTQTTHSRALADMNVARAQFALAMGETSQ